ncbi:MAG: RluA family pseudouridine synthase [Ruminococcaceae bacterium]|nr:RluA family pseudouridine synthase [Oscillospiraceae bacterium]
MIFKISESSVGVRLDAYLASATGESRNAVVRAIDEGRVTLNGSSELADKKYKLKDGDEIAFEPEEVTEYEAEPENISLDVIYEDGDIIVINKPSGMVVHPAAGNLTGTLVNALLYHCKDSLSGIGGVMRPGIVHRIDKDTSGLLVCAKNDFAHRALSEELEHHGIVREYHALVNGGFKNDTGTVDLPIGRHPVDRKKMAVILTPGAHTKHAITHYEVVCAYGRITHLKLILETGRTHQIRVHMSHTGHPLLGDTVYGGGKTQFEKAHARLLSGQALHAKRLTLTHPRTNERMTFESELPDDFKKLLEILNKEAEN